MYANNLDFQDLEKHEAIKLSTYGLNCIGTPHQADNSVRLGNIALDVVSASRAGYTNKNILRHLAVRSEILSILHKAVAPNLTLLELRQ